MQADHRDQRVAHPQASTSEGQVGDRDPQWEPAEGAARVIAAQVPGITALLSLAVAVVVIAGLSFAQDVLIPITLAILLSFVLSPVVALMRRLRVPRVPAVFLAVLSALGLLIGVVGFAAIQVASLAEDAPTYARTVEAKIERISDFAAERFSFLHRSDPASNTPRVDDSVVDRATAAAGQEPIAVRIAERPSTAIEVAGQWLAPALSPLQTLAIVLVVAIFILMQKQDLRDRFIRLFGSSDLHRTTIAIDDAVARLSRYFLTQLAVNACYGVVVTIGLWLIGLPAPALWGIVAAILRFVPYVGSLLGSALPLLLAAGVDPGWAMVIWVALLFAVLDPLLGYGIEPLLYGRSTGLSPLAVVLAAVFWTWIWGPVGLLLSMPLTLCLVVLGRHMPSLQFLDVMLGDRPALTPVESFYQRMLADDAEEALEQAEVLLASRSLTNYYDEVALGGLKLAAEDFRRGAVDVAAARRMVAAMLEVVGELDEHDDAAPVDAAADGQEMPLNPLPPAADEMVREPVPASLPDAPTAWTGAGSIVCVAGRGVLDNAVTAMLEQLLERRGFGVRRVEHGAAARGSIERLDLGEARLLCLSYLEIGGTPRHLRNLIRRLRRRAPGVPIMVGLWPDGDPALTDEGIQRELGADSYVATFEEAVETSLQLARAGENAA